MLEDVKGYSRVFASKKVLGLLIAGSSCACGAGRRSCATCEAHHHEALSPPYCTAAQRAQPLRVSLHGANLSSCMVQRELQSMLHVYPLLHARVATCHYIVPGLQTRHMMISAK